MAAHTVCLGLLLIFSAAAPARSVEVVLSRGSGGRRQPRAAAPPSPGNATALPLSLAAMADKCQCRFSGPCTCEGSMTFMNCIAAACASNRCQCSEFQFLDACSSMGQVCPGVKLQCSHNKASCLHVKEPRVHGNATQPVGRVEERDAVDGSKTGSSAKAPPAAAHEQVESAGSLEDAGKSGTWRAVITGLLTIMIFVGLLLIAAYFYDKHRLEDSPMRAQAPQYSQDQSNFSFSIFGCHEDGWKLCLLGFCCPSIRWADTLDKANSLQEDGTFPTFWRALAVIVGIYLVYLFVQIVLRYPVTASLLSLSYVALGVYYRQKLRRKFGIPSQTPLSYGEDLLAWCCCSPCAVVQEAREVEHRRRAPSAWVEKVESALKGSEPGARSTASRASWW